MTFRDLRGKVLHHLKDKIFLFTASLVHLKEHLFCSYVHVKKNCYVSKSPQEEKK
jgi:hypothetical protein